MHDEPPPSEDYRPANDDIPEETEDMTISDEAGHTFTPPTRLSARFYRPTPSRRKSSAASSRRNSLSSTHSLQSNSSYAQARRSNHVAQYLRRASIIQSRKDRLAAREAHAEQVRLRAALAKAACRSSNSEERAIAAEKARQERLAQIAASCAEEVRRSKKVAEENKAKKAAEEERLRLETEQRHAEAERRRQEIRRNLRRPRNTSSPQLADLKKPLAKNLPAIDEETAAKRIQSAWRTSRRKRVLDRFHALGMSIDKVHDTTFEEVRARLNEEPVLEVTTALLKLFDLHPTDEKEFANQMFTRTFLSAYMLLGHPAEVLSTDGDQEKDLISKAKELIISFEDVLSKCTLSTHYSPPATPLESLRLAHSTYCTAFADWKAKDATIMIETLVNSFVSLESIWQSVKDDTDGGVSKDYSDGIRESQVIVLNKIHKLAGRDRGNGLVRKALREHKRNQFRRKPTGDLRPRAAAEAIHQAPLPAGDAPSTVTETAANLTHEQAATSGSIAEALNKLFSVFPPNRVLTHELALDKSYRVDISPHSQLNDELNRELCNKMCEAFHRNEGAVWTVAMAENIRTKLLHLVKTPKHPLQPVIADTLDPDHVSQQVQQGIFSYPRFFGFMATILPKLCAPFRDEQVKALAQDLRQDGGIDEMIEKLFRLLHIIDLLCLDYSNFLLTSVAPTLIKEAQGYEHRMFAHDLENEVHTLDKTKRWWRNASVNICTENDRQDPGSKPSVQKIYARGLTDLAIVPGEVKIGDVPETLHLDVDRIKEIRSRALRISIIGAVLITAKNLLKRDVRHQWKAEANRMWEILKGGFRKDDDSLAAKLLAVIESAHALPPATKSQLQGIIGRLIAQGQAGKLTDPVVRVLFQRLKTHIFNRLSASSSGERVRVATAAGEGLAASGLPEFVTYVGDMVDLLTRMSEVDRKSHGLWYEQVAKEVQAMGEEEGDSE